MIREVIVVEGINDKQAVERAVEADVWVTGGSAVSERLLQALARLQKTRGVILLTDPDYAGERIRRRISDRVPGCKHAFLPRSKATENGDVGVENASPDAIRTALASVRTETEKPPSPSITREMLLELGLDGHPQAAHRREAVGALLGIGYGSAKTFWRKLNTLGVSVEELVKALEKVESQMSGEVRNP